MVVESYEQAIEIARDAVKNNSVFTTLDCSPCMASYTVDAEGVESWDVYVGDYIVGRMYRHQNGDMYFFIDY